MAFIAILLHFQYLRVIPFPIFQPDSPTYYLPAIDLLEKGQFTLSPERTPLYSVILYGVLGLTGDFFYVIFLQHLLSIAGAFLMGWVAFRFFNVSKSAAIFVGCFITLLPGQLTFAHHVMTEMPYTFFLSLFVFLFFQAMKNNRFLWWGLSGLTLACLMLLRPVGIGVAGSFVLTATIFFRQKNLWRGCAVALAVFICITGAWSFRNWHRHGFFGLSNLGPKAFFAKTAHLLEVEKLEDSQVKSALEPIYKAYPDKIHESNWVCFDKNGPVQVLSHQGFEKFMQLALIAIGSHPGRFMMGQLADFAEFIFKRSAGPQFIISKEFSVVSGVDAYWKTTDKYIRIKPDEFEPYFNRLRQYRLYPFDREGILAIVLMPIPLLLYVIPALALLAGLLMLRDPQRRQPVFMLLMIVLTHIVLTNLGADKTPRHAIPIESLYLLLLAAQFLNSRG